MVITAPVGATLLIAVFLFIVIADFLVWLYLQPHTPTEKKDFAQVAATLAAGIVLLAQMFLAGLNLQVTRDTANQKAESDREGQITERYTRAVEQLGSESITIQLGGCFALERISWDSARDHITVVELLCSFVQEQGFEATKSVIRLNQVRARLTDPNTTPVQREGLEEEERALMYAKTSTHGDFRAIIKVLGRRNLANEATYSPGLNLSSITLDGLFFCDHFERVGFFGTTLRAVTFSVAHLEGANLNDARLEDVHFLNCFLEGADFTGAHFDSVLFENTSLQGTRGLTQQHIEKCAFAGYCALPLGLHLPGELPPGRPASTS